MIKAFILILFVASIKWTFAQVEDSKKVMEYNKPKFYEDFLNFQSTKPGMTRLDIFLEIPYSEMHFVKTGNAFQSDYSVTISVFAEDKEKLIDEKLWDEKINVKDFRQTSEGSNYNISIKSFDLKPDKYYIRTSVDDKDTKNSIVSANMYTIRDLTLHPNISDVMFIAKETVVEGSTKILPNVTRQLNVQKEGIPLFFEIYTDIPQKLKMNYVVNEGKKEIYSDTVLENLDSGKTQVFHNIKIKGLGLGTYLVNLKLLDPGTM